jgi:hypothetical protein
MVMAFQLGTNWSVLGEKTVADSAAALLQSLRFQFWGGGLVVFPVVLI